ncbi:MAG TPA: YraN family protein [Puia sp.]|nr:YraN family protein [Puia sp.]
MAAHNNLGKKGEVWANEWLTDHGFKILHQNWRFSHSEIDIIAAQKNILHIVEVKCRSNNRFGYPEESVDDDKVEHLLEAAEEYVHLNPEWSNIQFDVLSIQVKKSNQPDFFLVEDIYV